MTLVQVTRMALLKIPKKVKATSYSNETQTLAEKHHSSGSKPDTQPSSLKDIPTPFIDRISVIAEPQSLASGKDILDRLMHVLAAPSDLSPAQSKKKYGKAFRIAPQAVLAKTKWPLLQLQIDSDAVMQARVEFSPADIKGPEMGRVSEVVEI